MATSALPKWQEVRDQLVAELERGVFDPGSPFYKISDVCERFGISDITGRRVFRELKQQGLVAIRGRRGTVVTHSPRPQTVYMCLRDDFFLDGQGMFTKWWIYHEILMGLTGSGLSSLFDFKVIPFGICLEHPECFIGKQIIMSADVGLQVKNREARTDFALLNRIESSLHPIFFHAYADIEGLIQVGTDLRQAAYKCARHLIEKGHCRLALLSGETNSPWFQSRLRGYLDALHDAGYGFRPELVRVTSGVSAEEDHAAVSELLSQARPPTAILAASDRRALNVLSYCDAHGISIPADLSVTGIDNLSEALVSRPQLTTCDGRHREQGEHVAELLRRRVQGEQIHPHTILVEPELVVRESTGPAREYVDPASPDSRSDDE